MYESPELRRLFSTYSNSKTPGRESIADHLSTLSMAEHRDDTLIVATATDLAVYPGGGAPPQVQGFRINIPGFTELTAISHLGPAIASIVAISLRGEDELWRRDAQRLIDDTRRVRAADGTQLWQESLEITAFEGREERIAAMVDYACAISERYLVRALAEPGYLSPATLRDDLLDGRSTGLPVSMNRIMIATFALYALDFTHRLVNWLDEIRVDWDRTLFAITGRQGRPTAGTSKATTNLARIMHLVSGGRLSVDRIFVAPTMPGFETPRDGDLSEVVAAEEPIRWQLARVMSSAELAPIMYDGYPRFAEPGLYGPDLHVGASSVTEMPRIHGPDDWLTMFTRLRLTLEDPRQLLAAGVTDFVAEQLLEAGNDPMAVTVPGLDGEPYPPVALAAPEQRQ
ncbi:DUF5624 domain-containing protein [Agromyces sp. Soil535]|uniref:DUF5624 domain-containing protein n=1 Tax=Agromyces sp. Soil535 TaxID=1736390 RepID=UPI0007013E4A|nr:DUF5624 domain-containing protein [Agromyces sp. Soil535]KRE23365.1 hypothetical protein ASG80_06510 [Agromyces sp. Soil535]